MMVGSCGGESILGSYRADRILGRGGDDTIDDGDHQGDIVWANDTLIGGTGADIFKIGAGNDTVWGGDEHATDNEPLTVDTVDYSSFTAPITVAITGLGASAAISVRDGMGGTDTLNWIEKIVGT